MWGLSGGIKRFQSSWNPELEPSVARMTNAISFSFFPKDQLMCGPPAAQHNGGEESQSKKKTWPLDKKSGARVNKLGFHHNKWNEAAIYWMKAPLQTFQHFD